MNPSNRNTMTAASGSNEVLGTDSQHYPLRVAPRRAETSAGKITTWPRREVVYTLIGLVATFAAYLMLSLDVQSVLAERLRAGYLGPIAEQVCFILIVYFIIYGNLVYHFSRLGHWQRQVSHRAASRAEIEAIYDYDRAPALAVLVPSYKEEERVVHQTLLSAALMEYPRRRVVLLIDDPPNPKNPEDAEQLERMRRLPDKIEDMLSAPARKFQWAMHAYEQRRQGGLIDSAGETRTLVKLYQEAAVWIEQIAANSPVRDHTDKLFVESVLMAPARAHRERAAQLLRRSRKGASQLTPAELLREYRRLAALFSVEITSFERKTFANLSRASNKAMNLNSYIDLMGGHFRRTPHPDGPHLERCEPERAELSVAAADYLITLDADSLLMGDYALRLIHVMEREENRRVAVVQTPYSAVPGTLCMIERVAGATTDVQHILHQGYTWMGATYWVGANALLRRAALDDIRVIEDEDGKPVAKYIQDRTVIEDTESSIDLILRGWQLYNYPERLAYSATPPDFGALIIQRRRWANGGLLILPKLMRHLCTGPGRAQKAGEGFLRFHYLTSLAGVSLGMLILILHPFDHSMRSWWLPLTALPYFVLYGRDLVASGYKWRDLPRVYALNLLLIPVNLGGVAKSLYQACTGRRSAFGRTPKVEGRTAAPRFYVATELAILFYCLVRGVLDLASGLYLHAAFAFINGALLAYAVGSFVGFREALEDIGLLRPHGEMSEVMASSCVEAAVQHAASAQTRPASAAFIS
jgi:cellulose synthase/poly-beta-1,6-N-acetylglucosamine synthase-like glycosyltransferase